MIHEPTQKIIKPFMNSVELVYSKMCEERNSLFANTQLIIYDREFWIQRCEFYFSCRRISGD